MEPVAVVDRVADVAKRARWMVVDVLRWRSGIRHAKRSGGRQPQRSAETRNAGSQPAHHKTRLLAIVANLTLHETGLKDWAEADLIRTMREGRREDGTAISEYMAWNADAQMGDAELRAIYAYLRTVPAIEKGNR